MPRIRPESLALHVSALLGALSMALGPLGCEEKSPANSQVEVTIPPAPSAEAATVAPPPAEPSTTPSASATAAAPEPSAQASASASASALPVAAPSAPKPVTTAKPRKKQPLWVEGRPFLVGDVARLAALGSDPDWADEADLAAISIDPAAREALLRHYTAWALAEHASIASFARFTLQLLALGAPPNLIVSASRAIEDEARHARLGFGLVTALSGVAVGPGELRIDGALDATTLEETLRLTVREGMIGETIAALEARLAAEMVAIPSLKEPLQQLAEEESRHAELAFAFAAWAIRKAPELGQIVQEEIESWEPPQLEGMSGLDAWGVLDAATRKNVHREGFEQVVRPLARKLKQGIVSEKTIDATLQV